ncbi:MAG: hypothetical protein J6M39_06740 [Lachnospiraceae bacterium]|nr:hypothetical protein [Lachnospiraceae bacterium]
MKQRKEPVTPTSTVKRSKGNVVITANLEVELRPTENKNIFDLTIKGNAGWPFPTKNSRVTAEEAMYVVGNSITELLKLRETAQEYQDDMI